MADMRRGGWVHRDARAIGAMEFIYELSEGTKGLPVREFEGSGKGGTGTGGSQYRFLYRPHFSTTPRSPIRLNKAT